MNLQKESLRPGRDKHRSIESKLGSHLFGLLHKINYSLPVFEALQWSKLERPLAITRWNMEVTSGFLTVKTFERMCREYLATIERLRQT